MEPTEARPDWMPPEGMPVTGYLGDYLAFWLILLLLLAGTCAFLFVVWHRRGIRTALTRTIGVGLVVATTLWSVALGFETYLRYVYDASDSYGLMVTNWAWFSRHWRQNSQGCRDGEFERDKTPGVRRVVFVGDSFAAGYGLPDPADLFSSRVRDELAARAPGGYEVWNGAFIGAQTGREGQAIEGFRSHYGADHVVLAYCLNDLADLLPEDAQFRRDAIERDGWLDPWTSFLLDFLHYRMVLSSDPRISGYYDWVIGAYTDDEVWGRQVERFAAIAEHARTTGLRLDVVVFPFFGPWGPDYPFHEAHDRVVAAWEELGVRTLDLRETYQGLEPTELMANRFDAHPNAYAHELASRTILRELFPR